MAAIAVAANTGKVNADAAPIANPARVPLSAVATLGRKMFFDATLSASGKQSCASCHEPATAYAPDNALAVQFGGPDLKRPGIRAVPSLGYMNTTPVFSIGPESLFEVDPQPMNGATTAGPPLSS